MVGWGIVPMDGPAGRQLRKTWTVVENRLIPTGDDMELPIIAPKGVETYVPQCPGCGNNDPRIENGTIVMIDSQAHMRLRCIHCNEDNWEYRTSVTHRNVWNAKLTSLEWVLKKQGRSVS
tara:strand:- start:384 stop:743 length:360 start_codon:yes stop_codon:yes gene_type:complete